VPEGLDQASAAFQSAINPAAAQPRDTGGRFQSTNAKPEPMFEPRPLEGDEKTGDTRDAGDDPRLQERERRIADGRAEQGDEDGPRARNAARDVQHGGEGDEQAGADDKPEQHDQDGEGADEGADAKGAPGEDAQGEKWALTLNGQPVEKLEVTVDGQETPVPNAAIK